MITIITAATHGLFKPFLDYSLPRAKRFGYDVHLIDLLEYGEGTKYDISDMGVHSVTEPWMVHMRAQKLEWILKAWEETSGNRVWMDADAMVLHPFDEVFEDEDFDIAFTLNEKIVYTGVFFMRDTVAAKQFVEFWSSKVRTPDQLEKRGYGSKGDQFTLKKLLPGPLMVGKAIEFHGARLKFVSSKVYNYTPRGPLSPEAKILHLDGTKKKKRWEMIKDELPT